jgi:hypothetical protein
MGWQDDALAAPASAGSGQGWQGDPIASARPANAHAPLRERLFERPEDEALYQGTLARIRFAATNTKRPQLPMAGEPPIDNSDEGMHRRAYEIVLNQRTKEAEDKAFEESRTPVQRVGDAAMFLPEAAVRTATGGRRGLADIADWTGGPQAGQMIRDTQGNFGRANESELGVLKRIGDVTLGIPMLSTMGAPLEATAGAALAAARTPRAMLPAQIKSAARGALTDARLEDLGAFERSNVTPFGPAFTETGTAGAVKQLSEAPIVGAPVRNALVRTIGEARDAGERVASQYGEAGTYRDAGQAVQGAVRRGVEQARDTAGGLPGTGTARSYRDAGVVAREGLENFSDARSADTVGSAGSALKDEQIASIASQPARETSVKTKQDAVYERAWRNLPQDMKAGRSKVDVTRFMSGLTETRAVLGEIVDRNMGMIRQTRMENGKRIDLPVTEGRIAYPVRGGLLGQAIQDILETTSTRSIQDVRNLRSDIRRLASGMSDTEKNTLTNSDMMRIQSALTRDLAGTLERNAAHYAAASPDIANRIRYSARQFRRADQFTRTAMQRIEALEKLYDAGSPELLAQNILKDAQGAGKGNLSRLVSLRRSLPNEDWDEIAGGILAEMGRPAATARDVTQEAGYSVNNLIDNLAKMSPEGRNALFGHNPELRRSLAVLEKEARAQTGPLERFYGSAPPERIGLEIVKDAEGGRKGGNIDRLSMLRRQMTDAEWGNVGAAALREMGKPVGSARGITQDAGFSVQSAFTRWQNMSPEGRRILFGAEGARVQSLNDFIRVADRLANFEALTNTSRSATNALGLTGLASIVGAASQLLMGNPGAAVTAGSVGASMYGFGKFLTSPTYVRWLTRAVKLSRDPRAAFTLRDHARELARLAANETDPAIEAVARALIVAAGNTPKQLPARPSQ